MSNRAFIITLFVLVAGFSSAVAMAQAPETTPPTAGDPPRAEAPGVEAASDVPPRTASETQPQQPATSVPITPPPDAVDPNSASDPASATIPAATEREIPEVGTMPAEASTASHASPPTEADADGPRTLFQHGPAKVTGGFGGIGVNISRFANKSVPLVCAEGAVIMNYAFSFGLGGCGVTTEIDATDLGPEPHDPDDRLGFGYGGAIVRYHFFARELANLAVGALIGAGGLAIAPWHHDRAPGEVRRTHAEGLFLFEPQLGGYVNLTRWMRLGVNAGYRIVSPVQTEGLSASEVGGFRAGGQLQFGWF